MLFSGRHLHLLMLCLLFLCAGCSSSSYKITLRDGREFMASTRPEYNAKTGYYKFRSLQDKDALIRADEVLLIHEQ